MFILIAFVIAGMVEASVGTTCMSEKDCDSGECCMAIIMVAGKRALSGTCQPLGIQKTHCYVNNEHHHSAVYVNRCPCAPGFTCHSSGFMDMPLGLTGQCMSTKKRETSCHSGAECGPDECCKSRNRPIGRRQAGGVCEPLGKTGSSCLAKDKSGKPKDMVFVCPCESSRTCVANGIFDVPIGELGNCS